MLRVEGRRADVADEARAGVVRPVAALQREVTVGHVLGRIRGQGLLALGRRPLLLHLHVAEHGDEDDEDDEAHAAADDQAEPAGQDAGEAAALARGRLADDRVGRVEGAHLRAAAHRRVHHDQVGRALDHVVLGRGVPGVEVLGDGGAPAAQAEHADQVARVRGELGQPDRARLRVQQLAAHLETSLLLMLAFCLARLSHACVALVRIIFHRDTLAQGFCDFFTQHM